jgi:thioredoxin reductase/Pyruvate/2-oxoacid:ferredoxin oxidoreductase delta subunit
MDAALSEPLFAQLFSKQYVGYYLYLLTGALSFFAYRFFYKHRDRQNLSTLEIVKNTGLGEPATLHPVIDHQRCLGCGACVKVCPEIIVLGMIDNKAHIINGSHCIGHGACKDHCPHDAITLVFGTEKRGVDIPYVSPTFETSVPGIFIAGELGGMGLIRNAIEQGKQAMESIIRQRSDSPSSEYDVIIIGAGPAGLSASLAALQAKLRFVTIEQEALGGTVAHFPRGKLVMTAPFCLPIIGPVNMRETTKEALLQLWQDVEQKTGLKINYQERMEDIVNEAQGFTVKTNSANYRTKTVLLTIGRRGTPRKLDVPGEELNKVVYSLIDPEQYAGQHVLVVGGGDAALEAAASIAEEPGTTVTLSYRGDAFSRAKEKNRNRVDALTKAKRLKVLLNSGVKSITPETVIIEHEGNPVEIANNVVIVCAGGVLPTPFLKKVGIKVETKYGTL